MSDNEAHPSMGGKSLETAMLGAGRPPYKSWRKKFRKMRAKFDAVLEENKRLFKEEQKLEGLARRLTEELDGLMEILLDLNQSSALPPDLRFDVALPPSQRAPRDVPPSNILPDNVQPEHANEIMREYINAVQAGRLPALDLHVMREHIQDRLAQQDIRPLPPSQQVDEHIPENPEGHPSFLSAEQEDLYLARLDAAASDPLRPTLDAPQASHQADLTPRELERQMELLNPQSQHNWLRTHSKAQPVVDDDESIADQPTKASKKRPSGKNLARQVMMDRTFREGFSPSEMSGMGEDDHDENAARRRGGGDKDTPYRAKGGRSGGSTKSKRKRTTDEGGAGGGKRMRASEIFD
ncbi:hypothetical protein AMS68_006720 [Peltaster fructicola]|uniref:Uncharacterized protein n=1 Tax=Peltaster fructicola TaxID=286661 RepID=A0A6H0Y2F8_9PEZI|nr:hypothetical protein AMS68_006720 [Peltaster fructicola]